MNANPFLAKGYISPELFCDRENETKTLLSNIQNGLGTTLISPRKMGKTGLILHTFYKISEEKLPLTPIYVDIFATLSLKDFIKTLSEAILAEFPEKTSIGSKFMTLLKGYRPTISYDPASGLPQVGFNFVSPNEQEYTLKGLFDFLNSQKKRVVLAIDEFQQITEYPEKMSRRCCEPTRNRCTTLALSIAAARNQLCLRYLPMRQDLFIQAHGNCRSARLMPTYIRLSFARNLRRQQSPTRQWTTF